MIQSHNKFQPQKPVTEGDSMHIFKGGGEMGALMQGYNWEEHPLGSPEQWPQSLKSNIRLLLHSGFPMFIWWSEAFYMFHNDAYLPALGKKHPKALGASAREIWTEIWDQVGPVAEGILDNGRQFYAEDLPLLLDRKGFMEETYWTFSYSPLFDDEGHVAGIFCACQEVTSTILGQRRLNTLKEVSEAMARFQTLAQGCETACQKIADNKQDIPFSLIYLLQGGGAEAKLCGKTGEIPDQATPATIKLADTVEEWPLAQVLQTGQLQIIEFQPQLFTVQPATTASASVTRAVIHPIFRPGQSQVIGFFISGISPLLEYDTDYQNFHKLLVGQIATSVTSVQAREELARHKEYLNDVFEQAPVGISILHGPEHVITLANQGICHLWGRKQEAVLGKRIIEALPEIKNQGIMELLDGVFTTGIPYVNTELPLMLERNGKLETDYFSFVYHPIRNSHGIITGVIAVAISINQQVEARHAIEAMNRELLATNADLDNFVYSASHDLKAPISNIEGLVDALIEHLPAETLQSDTTQRLLHHMRTSIERFKRAVTDLSQVTRIQREANEDVEVMELADVVADVKLDFEPMIAATKAEIVTAFAPGSAVRFSAKNIRSVVYNLLSNALKYRSPDRRPHIRIKTEITPEFIILSVADNGLGIDLNQKKKIFSMFKRLHDHVEGSGIGLYIVKRIIENAGGKIEVESEVGEGTTFKVYFKH